MQERNSLMKPEDQHDRNPWNLLERPTSSRVVGGVELRGDNKIDGVISTHELFTPKTTLKHPLVDMKLVETASPMNVQHRKQSMNKQQQPPDNHGSFTDLRSSGHFDMESLHSSFGSLNASMSSLGQYHDADQFEEQEAFFSPRTQQSPWNVKLRKTEPKRGPRWYNNSNTASRTGDWRDASASSLLADFNPDSPEESPMKKRFTKPPLPSTKPVISTPPVYESPVKKKKTKVVDSPVPTKPKQQNNATKKEKTILKKSKEESVSPKKKAKKTTIVDPKSENIAVPAAQRHRRKKFTPPDYGPRHVKAATRIAALARGRSGRMQAKLRLLERRLERIEVEKLADVMEIQEKCKKDKKDLKKRAKERFTKNLNRRGHQDTMVEENQATIDRIRKENTRVREQNKKIAEDIEALRINNERLTVNQAATEACFSQLQYHDDTCEGENARLKSIAAKYEKAIDDHQEHLDMQNSHIEAEERILSLYKNLLDKILARLDESKGYKVLTNEVLDMAEELEEFDRS